MRERISAALPAPIGEMTWIGLEGHSSARAGSAVGWLKNWRAQTARNK